jgi:FtsH-binding integral membrane protein
MATNYFHTFQENRFTSRTLLSFTELSSKVQRHLVDVYRLLFVGMCVAAVGVVSAIYLEINQPFLTMIGAIIAFTCMMSTPRALHQRRVALYAAFCALKGASIAPLVHVAFHIDPSVLGMAAGITAVIFLSFSVVALTARRREYLYLGGLIGSLSFALFILGLANLFLGSSLIFELQLWGGLAIFVGWVVIDTQVIIEKATNERNPDALAHAGELFVDLIAIFVRVVIILLRNSKKRED